MRRYFVIPMLALAIPFAAHAAFIGPSQAPPDGNVPGVVWNMATAGGQANEQTGTEFNIDGSGRLGGDVILGDTKALRIDSIGAATFNIGNWGNGVQPLTIHIFGDLVAEPADASEGSITAPKFCIGVDCIDAWPVGGGGGSGITSIVPGLGISGGGDTGDIDISFDEGYGDARYVNVDGDSMNGELILSGDPIDPFGATPKQYVDAVASQKLDLAGGTMSGALILNADPALNLEAATKQYVDTANGTKLDLNGGTMTGLLTLSGDPSPVNDNGAVTVHYLNAVVGPINAALPNYVLKAGDTMTGGLVITGSDVVYGRSLWLNKPTAQEGIRAAGIRGVVSAGTSYAYDMVGSPPIGININAASNIGGYMKGGVYGVQGVGGTAGGTFTNSVLPANAATIASNNTGGYFSGTTYGVNAASAGTAGQFTNANTPTNVAKLGGTAYAGEFNSAVGTYSVYAQQNLRVGGDITAMANALSACVWTAYVADGAAILCPAATPIMSGVQRGAGTERIYCCAL